MPLTSLQIEILKLLAANRNPDSYVAGGTPLNRDGIRFSKDIDIFHDLEEKIGAIASLDAALLQQHGFDVTWRRKAPAIYTAIVSRRNDSTSLEWVADSDYRFFPIVPDEVFGYRLHPIDLATNKVMAAVGRRELRDLVDLVTIHQKILPLGPVIWAAVDKAPGFTPEGAIAEIRRNSLYPAVVWDELITAEPIQPDVIYKKLRDALDEAEAFVLKMPTDKIGLLFLKNHKLVQPDPEKLDLYQTHAGRRRGHWPSNHDINAAMLNYYL